MDLQVERLGEMLHLRITNAPAGPVYELFYSSNFTAADRRWVLQAAGAPGQILFEEALPGQSLGVFRAGPFADLDSDGLSDNYEGLVSGTLPANADSDSDGVSDGIEVAQGRNPLSAVVLADDGSVGLEVFSPLK